MHTLVRSNSAALKCYEGAVIYPRINIHVSENASSADQKLIPASANQQVDLREEGK